MYVWVGEEEEGDGYRAFSLFLLLQDLDWEIESEDQREDLNFQSFLIASLNTPRGIDPLSTNL